MKMKQEINPTILFSVGALVLIILGGLVWKIVFVPDVTNEVSESRLGPRNTLAPPAPGMMPDSKALHGRRPPPGAGPFPPPMARR
jgi:hypothetical protein